MPVWPARRSEADALRSEVAAARGQMLARAGELEAALEASSQGRQALEAEVARARADVDAVRAQLEQAEADLDALRRKDAEHKERMSERHLRNVCSLLHAGLSVRRPRPPRLRSRSLVSES